MRTSSVMLTFVIFLTQLTACSEKDASNKQYTGAAAKDSREYDVRVSDEAEGKAAHEHFYDEDAADDIYVKSYNEEIAENHFRSVSDHPLSTFSIDVDTASYTMMRSAINSGYLPNKGNIRIEEFVNYFTYDYPQPEGEHPFSITTEATATPWHDSHRLVRIGLKGKEMANEERPASNLVFLVDTSGSMGEENKLPLLQQSLRLLVDQLDGDDRIAIVTYAGSAGVALSPTSGEDKATILNAIDNMHSGGSTNGEAGIASAYSQASANFIPGGVNRVILCTDGDFNVGQTDEDALVEMIRQKAENGIFLTALGFGMRHNDPMLETLADRGNGAYGYIDNRREARKILVEQVTGTLVTIAKDVKIQIEFNADAVAKYRLIGYENRLLNDEDFEDDTKDAGEIGAGHTVTALYEIELVDGVTPRDAEVDLFKVKLRYKQPTSDTSNDTEYSVTAIDQGAAIDEASKDLRFAAAVAEFGMLLQNSEYLGEATYDHVFALAESAIGTDPRGYRTEFVTLVEAVKSLGN